MKRTIHWIYLRKGEIIHSSGPFEELTCERGRLWITQSGVGQDIILADGQQYKPTPTGHLVIEALEPSCLEVTRFHGQKAFASY